MKHSFYFPIFLVFALFFCRCTKKEIQFGSPPDSSNTRLIKVDTVEAKLSTVILDSFATNGTTSFLLGNYNDSLFGRIEASPFFQLGTPGYFEIPQNAEYDSLVLVLKLNKHYYGDTTKHQRIQVLELAETLDYTFGSSIFNTSSFALKPMLLAQAVTRIRPTKDDTIVIRLSDVKGKELFNKMIKEPDEIRYEESFKKYFKGLALKYHDEDKSSVYGLKTDGIYMRLFYHTNIPTLEQQYKDFKLLQNNYSFNRLVANRSGTKLYTAKKGVVELTSEQTNNIAFMQPATGVLFKTIFPSLREILQKNEIVKLLKAVLILRPIAKTYGLETPLPSSLQLFTTNATNAFGEQVLDTAGALLKARPQIDFVYGTNTYYRFEVTRYINDLLISSGLTSNGFYVVEEPPGKTDRISHAVIGNRNTEYKSELVLTILTVDK